MHQSIRRFALLAILLGGATITQASPAQAGVRNGCDYTNAVCLYDGKGWTGDHEGVGCGNFSSSSLYELRRLGSRVSSAINGCPRVLYAVRFTRKYDGFTGRTYIQIGAARYLGGGQWEPDFGARGFDNQANGLSTNSG